jgi:hypothetical protein
MDFRVAIAEKSLVNEETDSGPAGAVVGVEPPVVADPPDVVVEAVVLVELVLLVLPHAAAAIAVAMATDAKARPFLNDNVPPC